MADLNPFNTLNTQIPEIELEVITAFLQGRKRYFANSTLRIENNENGLMLISPVEGVVSISKAQNEWKKTILVRRTSIYVTIFNRYLKHNIHFNYHIRNLIY